MSDALPGGPPDLATVHFCHIPFADPNQLAVLPEGAVAELLAAEADVGGEVTDVALQGLAEDRARCAGRPAQGLGNKPHNPFHIRENGRGDGAGTFGAVLQDSIYLRRIAEQPAHFRGDGRQLGNGQQQTDGKAPLGRLPTLPRLSAATRFLARIAVSAMDPMRAAGKAVPI